MDSHLLSTPQAIAERGERIYRERYREEYERSRIGAFVAIDVTTEKAFVGDTPESALDLARVESPAGIFHLIQVGFPAAFRVSYSGSGSPDWVFQP